jgi:hypothetical protein
LSPQAKKRSTRKTAETKAEQPEPDQQPEEEQPQDQPEPDQQPEEQSEEDQTQEDQQPEEEQPQEDQQQEEEEPQAEEEDQEEATTDEETQPVDEVAAMSQREQELEAERRLHNSRTGGGDIQGGEIERQAEVHLRRTAGEKV